MTVEPTQRVVSERERAEYEKALDCVHCGLCLPACPTYAMFGREGTGPRGRIYALRGLAEGAIEATPEVTRDLDLCLVCRACEPVCPSGVKFGELMEHGRTAYLEPARPRTMKARLKRLAVRHVLPYPRRVRWLGHALALYERLGIRRLLRSYGTLKWLSPELEIRDRLLPPLPRRSQRKPLASFARATTERRGHVAVLEGCAMQVLLPDVNRATVRSLTDQGFDVSVPPARTCCGALSAHFGALDVARKAALRTIRAFARLKGLDAIVVNSAGCGALMKEYPRLLEAAPGVTDEQRRAAHSFAARVKDYSEFLAEAGLRTPPGRVDAAVAYADACHLAHGQRITEAPRTVLAAVPGVRLVPLDRADRCCGAAGLFNALQPVESMQMLDERIGDLRRSSAEVLASANPGCLLQWRAGVRGAGLPIQVLHVAEILDRAQRGTGRQGREP